MQQLGDLQRSMECYEKAAIGQERQNSLWHAAKMLEKAADVAKDAKNMEAVADLYGRAAEYYASEGRGEAAAEVLARGAKSLELIDPVLASTMYEKAIYWIEESGKHALAGDIYRGSIAHYVKSKDWVRANEALLKFAASLDSLGASSAQAKAYLGAIVVLLSAGNAGEAWSTYQDALGVEKFQRSDEAFAADALFDAYRADDSEKAVPEVVAKTGAFINLDNQVARLAKSLPGDGDLSAMKIVLGGGTAAKLTEDGEEDLT